jgi:MarR family 2-MHQ and catechol resistance regulon transcriptional repressor
MPTRYEGTDDEKRSLDLMIKLARSSESFLGRLLPPITDAGLTPTQFGVLEALYHLGPLTPSDLAEKILKSRNNLTVVIANLERDGLVRRQSHETDRRSQVVHLTEEGQSRIATAMPLFVKRLVQEASVLTAEEQEQLSDLLRKLGKGT